MTNERSVIVPEETELTAPYWQGARNGELRLQRCANCAIILHPPQPICPGCRSSANLSWIAASGWGIVHAITVVEHAAHPAVRNSLPYTVMLVRLDEGPLIITSPPAETRARPPVVGARVQVLFETIADGDAVLPHFGEPVQGW